MLGEMTSVGDIAPVMTGALTLSNPQATGARRRIPTVSSDKQKKLRSRVAAGMIGQIKEDSRDGYVIPDDAKEVTTMDVSSDALPHLKSPEVPGEKIKNPYSGEEPLILPIASLVAPDVTPEAIYPLDPSQLPGGDKGHSPQAGQIPGSPSPAHNSPAIDTVLGKPPVSTQSAAAPGGPAAQPTPAMSTESALSRLPGIPSPSALAEAAVAVPSGAEALNQNQPMPEHVAGDGRGVMNAFSRFVPRGSMKIHEDGNI